MSNRSWSRAVGADRSTDPSPTGCRRRRSLNGLNVVREGVRVVAWNWALLAIEGALFVWAHSVGVSWAALGTLAASLLALVVVVIASFPAWDRHLGRKRAAELARWRAESALREVEGGSVQVPRLLRPAPATGWAHHRLPHGTPAPAGSGGGEVA
jgi:hypothetical protein